MLNNKIDATPKPWIELRSTAIAIDGDVGLLDLFAVLDGINGKPYSFARPAGPCP